MTKMASGNGFPAQTKSKLQYTKSSPGMYEVLKTTRNVLAAIWEECSQTYAAFDVERCSNLCDKSEI